MWPGTPAAPLLAPAYLRLLLALSEVSCLLPPWTYSRCPDREPRGLGPAGAQEVFRWHHLPRPSPDPQGSPRLLSATTCPPLTPLAERLLFGAAGGESRDGKLRDPRSRFFAQRVVGERPVPRPFPRCFTQPVQAASRGSARSCGLHPACLGCPASTLGPPPEQEVTPIADMNVRLRGESSGRDWHQVG